MNFPDHPLRYALVNELHARPFPALTAPCQVAYVALKPQQNAHARARAIDRAHLTELLDLHGVAHPAPSATHHAATLGRTDLKWESHTEFVTYSAFTPSLDARPFDPAGAAVLPADWLSRAAGPAIVAVLIRVMPMPEREAEMLASFEDWFVPESLAVARVVDGAAVIAGDFRIDAAGFMRFAVFVKPDTGARRIGRITQRLCEIETYRAMSMLGLPRARELSLQMNALDPRLGTLVEGLNGGTDRAEDTLRELLSIAAQLESLAVQTSFRFAATMAYEAIVTQRITALREERVQGRQTFAEFMMRRYDPAIRTVRAAEVRLSAMADRAARAAELLRTRVDVDRSAQNQALLRSMDNRADAALRLQHTVEGLSVVAVSYYALGLVGYLIAPLAEAAHLPKGWLMAAMVPIVVMVIWAGLRRLRGHGIKA